MGKRFVFSLPRLLHGDPLLTLCLTSYRNTTFSLRYEPPQGSLQTHSIKANETFSMEEIVRDKYDSAVGVRRSYILTSETPVEVVAFLNTDLSISSFKLLPVSSWGDKYYAVTANENDNNITVKFMIEQPKEIKITYMGKWYSDGNTLQFNLQRDQSFSIEHCEASKLNEMTSLTGSKIVGTKPQGVLSGNCWSTIRVCDRSVADIAIDSPLPIDHYGTEFLLFLLLPYKELWFVAERNKTVITLMSPFTKIFMDDSNVWKSVNLTRSTYMNSSDPIQVVLAVYTKCPESDYENGAPSITSILPNRLFYHTYTWRSPKSHFVIVVIQNFTDDLLRWKNNYKDNNSLGRNSFDTFPVLNTTNWRIVYIRNFEAKSDYRLQRRDEKPFGCYIHFLGNYSSYITHLGFQIAPRRIPIEKVALRKLLAQTNVTNLQLSESQEEKLRDKYMNPWSEWQCVPTCSEHQQSRARTCNETLAKMEESSCNDAPSEKETREYSCYMKRCPTDCLIKQWGEDCAQSCEKCLDDCDKFTGHCYRCEPGFKGFTTACQTAEYDYEKSIIMGTVGVILLFLLTFFCLYVTGKRSTKRVAKSSTLGTKTYSQMTSSKSTDNTETSEKES